MYSPLDQFQITSLIPLKILDIDLSFTNSGLAMIIASGIFSAFSYIIIKEGFLIPTAWQNVIEMKYEFVVGMVNDQIGELGYIYLPLIYTLFVFILANNLLGLIPYSFTPTSHLIVALSMSFIVWVSVTILGFMIHGISFLNILKPTGVSPFLIPLIVCIEFISYCMRALSLGIRLSANMLAGHTLLHIISGFIWQFFINPSLLIKIFAIVPFIILIALTGLEVVIAFLQSYVFTILTCSYLNDAIHMH